MPIKKPNACKGCPFYDKSEYITPDVMLKDSEVLILAQNPGEHEEQGLQLSGYQYINNRREEVTGKVRPQPLIGASGNWLRREFWPLTKLEYASTSRANVIKCRPYHSNELPSVNSTKPVKDITQKMLKQAIAHCTRAYLRIPPTVKHILAMGGISLYALTKEESITDWRGWIIGKDLQDKTVTLGIDEYYTPMAGSTLYTQLVNVFPVLHIASLFQNPTYYHATLVDFIKFGRLVRGEWPRNLPQMYINKLPDMIPSIIGFDTEYDVTQNNKLTMFSLASTDGRIYVVDRDANFSRRLQASTEVVTQNGLVDLPHLVKLFDVSSIKLQDCMIAHSVLWPGEPHNLDYMTSMYGRYNRHKHLRETNDKSTKYLYAGLDADTTLNHVWQGIMREFESDPLSYEEYKKRRQPLLSIINRFQSIGIEVDRERASLVSSLLDQEMQEIVREAREITNNEDFNIVSTQQAALGIYKGIYVNEEEREKKERARVKKESKTEGKSKEKKLKKDKVTTDASIAIEKLKQELGV